MKTVHLKKWISALMAVLMLFTACPSLAEPAAAERQGGLTMEDLTALGAKAAVHDGRVTFVDGPCTAEPVMDMEDAAKVVDSMQTLTGGDGRTRFEPWRTLADAKGNRYYVFQQVYGETTVPGGAMKVVTDAEGRMLGLVASVESDLPDTAEAEGITPEQAEERVLQHLREVNQAQAELVEGRTERIILPVNPDIDWDETDEKVSARCHYVWAVYTTNTEEQNAERPYLAHYVTMDGTYLYSLQTILPGDEAATAGYDAAYVFEGKEPAEYNGTVKLSDGTEREISVTLMRDPATGKYYLGNIERRIAVADCYEFIYNEGRLVLEESGDNTGWDNTCLLSLYNYCKAWDYYHAIGWIGGDGLGTPILVLKDYCNRDHQPIDNAAYAGKYYGWQVFLSSSANDLAQCLDVLGHEFTHCVTGSVMTFNAYMNDFGAINEAMSDIQGNLCEMMAGETEDTEWQLGENSKGKAVRNMSDPHVHQQPGYTWDLYYTPKVSTPTQLNDRGGVHTNSSLLNMIAYRLCEKGGMTMEEARAFWFAADCSMVPGTDYVQLSDLLPWVLKNQGMEQYGTALEAALDATRLRTDEVPDTFDSDRAMVTLMLPEKEHFMDGNWALGIISVNTEEIVSRFRDIMARKGEYAAALDELAVLLEIDPASLPTEEEIAADPTHAWDRFAKELEKLSETPEGEEGPESARLPRSDDLMKLFRKYFGDTLYTGQVAAGQDGRTIRLVCRPGRTIPVLFRLEFDPDQHVLSAGLAVYLFGTWIDAGSLLSPILSELPESIVTGKADQEAGEPTPAPDLSWLEDLFGSGETPEPGQQEQTEPDLSWIAGLFAVGASGAGQDAKPDDQDFSLLGFVGNLLKELLFWRIMPGENNVLPAYGLDTVTRLSAEDYPFMKDMFMNVTEIMLREGTKEKAE